MLLSTCIKQDSCFTCPDVTVCEMHKSFFTIFEKCLEELKTDYMNFAKSNGLSDKNAEIFLSEYTKALEDKRLEVVSNV